MVTTEIDIPGLIVESVEDTDWVQLNSVCELTGLNLVSFSRKAKEFGFSQKYGNQRYLDYSQLLSILKSINLNKVGESVKSDTVVSIIDTLESQGIVPAISNVLHNTVLAEPPLLNGADSTLKPKTGRKSPKINGNVHTNGDNEGQWREWSLDGTLRKGGDWITDLFSSFLFLYAAYFLNSLVEAFWQAELIKAVTVTDGVRSEGTVHSVEFELWMLFILTATIQMSMLFVSMNQKFSKSEIELIKGYQVNTLSIVAAVFFLYNLIFAELRMFFQYGGDFFSVPGLVRALTGLIVPVIVSVIAYLINARLKKERK